MERVKTEIKICGKEYSIVGNEPPEYIQKIAYHLDKKIALFMERNPNLSKDMAVILAALNVGDEYFKLNDIADNLRTQIASYLDDISKLNAEIGMMTMERDRLEASNKQLEIQIAKKDTEIANIRKMYPSSR